MGESLFETLLQTSLKADSQESKQTAIKCLDLIHTVIDNLFIKTPLESEQDLEEIQFGFKVDTIAGKTIEEIKEENNMDVDQDDDKKINK